MSWVKYFVTSVSIRLSLQIDLQGTVKCRTATAFGGMQIKILQTIV